jgi:hypothetical protein
MPLSRPPRRLALTALSLALALALAAPPAQAREGSPLGWLDALAHQLSQWSASRWAWSAPDRPAAGQAGHPAKSRPVKLRIDCGGAMDPGGGCTAPAPPH